MEEEEASFIDQYKIPISIGAVGIVLVIGGAYSSGLFRNVSAPPKNSTIFKTTEKIPTTLKVDVSGAVNNPGVYILSNGSRVEEAIAAAGGISDLADQIYISKQLNLAQRVSDGMKIYLPLQGEDGGDSQVLESVTQAKIININNAEISLLDSLPALAH